MRFDLTDLRLFVHVHEAGTITDGARRTHITLASASERIKGMEDILGTALLERNRRGITLTPAGRTLVHHARTVLQQMSHLQEDLSQFSLGLKGHIRLLANTSAIHADLTSILATFLRENPHISIELSERPSEEIADALRNDLADIALVADSADLQDLHTIAFRADPLVLIAHKDHALAQQSSPLSFNDVLDHPFIGLSDNSALQTHLNRHAYKAGKQLQYRIRMQHSDAVCQMVAEGIGIAVVPDAILARSPVASELVRLELSDNWANRRLLLCVRNSDALPAYIALLLTYFRSAHKPDEAQHITHKSMVSSRL
jgi:molybdate transport repressor ModE-like protein